MIKAQSKKSPEEILYEHTNGTIITTQSNCTRKTDKKMIDYKKNERKMKLGMDVAVFIGFPLFLLS